MTFRLLSVLVLALVLISGFAVLAPNSAQAAADTDSAAATTECWYGNYSGCSPYYSAYRYRPTYYYPTYSTSYSYPLYSNYYSYPNYSYISPSSYYPSYSYNYYPTSYYNYPYYRYCPYLY